MIHGKTKFTLAVIALLMAFDASAAMSWEKVYQARDKGLPKTAIAELDPILSDALQHQRYAEAIKAIGMKVDLEGRIEGNLPEEKITRLQDWIAKAPADMKPMMEAVLAHWYWQYFQQNRWRFQQRTQTVGPPGKDFTAWDLPRILAEIDSHFSRALANQKRLKATPVAEYNDLLEKGAVPDSYRPTVFDFLAHEALQFYQAGEQGAAKAEDEFEIAADSPIFGTVAEFLKWQPLTTDAGSPKLKAVQLFQNLLAFHGNDSDKTAFVDADLWRLGMGNNLAVGADKTDRYTTALKRFVDEWSGHEISARALFAWATLLNGAGEPGEACKLAMRGEEAFPKSIGGIWCHNLVQQIQAKSVSLATERVWNEPWPAVKVTYRNLSRVYLRAVPYDFEKFIARQRWGFGRLDGQFCREILGLKPDAEWNAALPATADYRERTEKVAVSKDLKPGFHVVLASHDATFSKDHNQVSAALIWVSELALVVRQSQPGDTLDGFVLKALTGEPVAAATVRSWARDREGWLKPGAETQTDGNGMFRFSVQSGEQMLLARSGAQAVASANDYWSGPDRPEAADHQTVFFTDRALYRPGQTIYYKGIHFRFNRATEEYGTIAGEQVVVEFFDPNGKLIASDTRTSNEFGSFDGVFNAPADRVTGRMSIRHAGKGATWFNVEEYKRPKFQVELSRPRQAAKLGAEVVVPGKATAYSGAAIGGAKVKWRVVREIRFPRWCWWGRSCLPPGRGESHNIAHGSATSDSDGSFAIKFAAAADLSAPEKTEPTFTFQVYADVTDSSGETRSGSQSVRAGYAALQATLSAEEWQTPDKAVEWSIETASLDGEPQAAAGTLKVHALKQPETVLRAEYAVPNYDYRRQFSRGGGSAEPAPDPANPDSWALAEVAAELPFKTDATGALKLPVQLKAGIYRALLETKDRFGKTVTARQTLQVVDLQAPKYRVRLPNLLIAPKWSVEAGGRFVALWGTGYDSGRAYIELAQGGRLLRGWWSAAGRTQELIDQAVTGEQRGGFSLRVTYVRENRAYLENRVVDVPWSNKKLTLKWEHFTSKLEPGRKTSWTAVVTGPDAKKAVAEMAAVLYDASLDQYQAHNWMQGFDVFRRESNRGYPRFVNGALAFNHVMGGWAYDYRQAELSYRHYPDDIGAGLWGHGIGGLAESSKRRTFSQRASAMPSSMAMDGAVADAASGKHMRNAAGVVRKASGGDSKAEAQRGEFGNGKLAGGGLPQPDLNQVAARRNLNETAFFFPHLLSDRDGIVRMEFSMPEALTEWKFMGFVHDRELRGGFLSDKAVTSKDLMVAPNPPRFVREGDIIEFTVKVSNQSAARQTGQVRLTFADARTLKEMNSEVSIQNSEYGFDIPAKESKSFAWRMSIPDGCDFLTYKAVAATDRLSDGEEGYLPVLSRRILVSESLPLPVRGIQTKKFEFPGLKDSGRSRTLKSENLTVQMVSQPAWYAVMALPYLMEYPYDCSEQAFNRFYANALARFIANADPKIRRIFDLWKNTTALDSPLEKNQDLKQLLLEETPWLRQANDESQARRNIGLLFDANRLDNEARQALGKLAGMQLGDGLWPWFPGCRGDEYITLYIVTGFGRLRHLGAEAPDMSAALKALNALDEWMEKRYREILKQPHPEEHAPDYLEAFYLYGRSFFLQDRPVTKQHQEAVDFYLKQARKFWLKLDCRQSQAQLAIGMKRFGDAETPAAIMKSIKERSVSSEELGMFWRDLEAGWWWYRAPIEAQALMIEAFDEVAGDAQAVEECKVWLLKQKQTQDWKTTKATADAVYGLLLRGSNLLASDALVEVSLGGETIKPEKVEAGTGFYEKKFIRGEIKPAMGSVTVKKTDQGVSWGSLHWQYLEDLGMVKACQGTPLKLKKLLFRKENTKAGPVLEPVKSTLAVGDELVVRLELRVDRDMEYVHLKDQRGSGTEPVNVLSRTKFQDGLTYYESTRDTASHFFIHYLPKGVYVFEYSVRIQLKGKYQTGIASIQSMYAPEFNSHSASIELDVR